MWHEEQSHLSDQKTSPKKSFGDYVYSKAVQPSDTHVDSFNRFLGKRKLAANDVNLESNIKEFRSPVGVNEQESKNGGHNRKSFAEQTTSSQQAKIDNNYGTDFLEFCLTSGADSGRNATDKLNDASLSVPNTSLCHEEAPFTTVMHMGENVMVLTQQARTCQIEANICSPLPESCKAVSVAVQSDIELRNSKRSRLSNHTTQDNVQQECCHLKFEHLVSVGNSDLGVEINRSNEDSIKSAYSQKDSKYETPYELKESGLCPNTIRTSNPRHTEDCKTLENEVQFRGSMLGFLSSKTYESNDQNDVRSTLKAASPEMKNLKNTSVDDILSRNGSRPAILVEDGIVQHGGPSKANENVKLSSEKPVIIVTDQLWDGRVQLSSSVTVSAVAFFKSGEKLPDTSWSGFIEVKGKVRLEAFEKYVQDLPRSRNRVLMVISLCWKEGSSETEFAGMKEVSNGYKKGKKVGYAQLSAGTDLYICPCSSFIITILAKYGFFKGMSATEENQESMIGCVVWRKSQVCLNSVTKSLESNCKSSSEQLMASVSGSLSNQAAGKKSYYGLPGQKTKLTQDVKAVSTPVLECAGGIGTEIKKIESSKIHLELKKSSAVDAVPAAPLVPGNISITQMAQQMSVPFHGPFQASSGASFELKESLNAISGGEHSKMNWQEKNALIPVQYNVKKSCSPTFEEDDLPEYDFGIARGISSAVLCKGVGASMLDMKLLARGNFEQDGLVSSTKATVHTISAPSQRLDGLTVPRTSSMFLTRNRFLYDDDDDMPEWCPPEPYMQSLGEVNRPSMASPQQLQNSSFTDKSSAILPPRPPRPVILPPPPTRSAILPPPPSIHSQFSYRQLHPAVQVPITFSSNSPRSVPIPSSSSVLLGFGSNSALRPQSSSLGIRPPYQFSGRADWRPRR